MKLLWLSEAQAREIARHAMAEAPNEACGLIAGKGKQALQIIPMENVASRPREHYRIDDAAFVRAVYQFEADGLELMGIYHSHPQGDPIPSPTDIQQAYYPDSVYLIVGLRHGEPRLAAWRICSPDVERISLHIGDEAPEADVEGLSQAQRVAILVSAVIAVALMLAISLSLLPPAPIMTAR